jgi:hypothetical protein
MITCIFCLFFIFLYCFQQHICSTATMAEWLVSNQVIAHIKAPDSTATCLLWLDLRPGSDFTARVRTPLVAFIYFRSHGLGVMTKDFESFNPGSNPGETFIFFLVL